MLLEEKRENREIRKQVVQLFRMKEQFNVATKEYKAVEASLITKIKNYMYCNKGCNEAFSFQLKCRDGKERYMNVKKVQPTSIVWDVEKLEEVLDKEDVKEVITKQYTIIDMQGLIEYLRSCGVSPKEFKKFIEVHKIVEQKALEQLAALGKVSEEELKPCYTLEKKNSYLRLDMKEGEQ